MRQNLNLGLVAAFFLVLLTACDGQIPIETNGVTPAPATARGQLTALPDEGPATGTSTGLIVNDGVQRSSLFHMNTLAYGLPGMDEVEVVNVTYAYHEDLPLTIDLYYPAGTPDGERLPLVIFGLGYRMSKEPLRNAHFYTSWGKLVAAAGMAAITYDTEQPDRDLETLMAFVRKNAANLRIDSDRIGFWSSSSNVPTVMSYLMQERRINVRFSVYYYGATLTPDRRFTGALAKGCANRGCLVSELADVTYVDPDLPLFVVKAGRDHIDSLNEAMDHFVAYAREAGAPVTYVEYEDGRHGFDTQQRTEESAEIIALTLQFMKDGFGLEQ